MVASILTSKFTDGSGLPHAVGTNNKHHCGLARFGREYQSTVFGNKLYQHKSGG